MLPVGQCGGCRYGRRADAPASGLELLGKPFQNEGAVERIARRLKLENLRHADLPRFVHERRKRAHQYS